MNDDSFSQSLDDLRTGQSGGTPALAAERLLAGTKLMLACDHADQTRICVTGRGMYRTCGCYSSEVWKGSWTGSLASPCEVAGQPAVRTPKAPGPRAARGVHPFPTRRRSSPWSRAVRKLVARLAREVAMRR